MLSLVIKYYSRQQLPKNMTIAEKYIQFILPYLSGTQDGGVETFTTQQGLTGYQFPCPLCSCFVQTDKLRVRQLASFTPYQKLNNCSLYYLCKCRRSFIKECRGSAKYFHNFLAIYNPSLFRKYKKELLLEMGVVQSLRQQTITSADLWEQFFPGDFL